MKTENKSEGTPAVAAHRMVLLRCPDCKRKLRVMTQKFDPPETAEMLITCTKCEDRRGGGTYDDTVYLDKNGKQILPYKQQNNRRLSGRDT